MARFVFTAKLRNKTKVQSQKKNVVENFIKNVKRKLFAWIVFSVISVSSYFSRYSIVVVVILTVNKISHSPDNFNVSIEYDGKTWSRIKTHLPFQMNEMVLAEFATKLVKTSTLNCFVCENRSKRFIFFHSNINHWTNNNSWDTSVLICLMFSS